METSTHAKPAYPSKSMEEIMRQVVGDPNCKRAGCHGKGYVGITWRDGDPVLITCSCARWGETDYVRAMRRLDGFVEALGAINSDLKVLHHQQRAHIALVVQILHRIERRSFIGSFKALWDKLTGKDRSIEAILLELGVSATTGAHPIAATKERP